MTTSLPESETVRDSSSLKVLDFSDLAEAVQCRRQKLDLDLYGIAARSGVSAEQVRRFEQGLHDSPRPDDLFRLLNALEFEPTIDLEVGKYGIDHLSAIPGGLKPRPIDVVDFPEMALILRQAREQRGWTHGQAGYLSGISRITIYGYERGSISTFAGRDYFRYLNALSMSPIIQGDDGPLQVDDLASIPGVEYR